MFILLNFELFRMPMGLCMGFLLTDIFILKLDGITLKAIFIT